LLADSGRLKEAREHYEKALRWQPDHMSARQNLGIALARAGLLEEAVEQFSVLLRFHPDDARGHFNLGLALAELGQEEEASRHRAEANRLVALKGRETNDR
jgi:tetratricopeptide (TPR) repeat protein